MVAPSMSPTTRLVSTTLLKTFQTNSAFDPGKLLRSEVIGRRYETSMAATAQRAAQVSDHFRGQPFGRGPGGGQAAIISSRPESAARLGMLEAGMQPAHIRPLSKTSRPYITEKDVQHVAAKLRNLDAPVVYVGSKRDLRIALTIADRARSNPGRYPTIGSIVTPGTFRVPKRFKHLQSVVVPLSERGFEHSYKPELPLSAYTARMPLAGGLPAARTTPVAHPERRAHPRPVALELPHGIEAALDNGADIRRRARLSRRIRQGEAVLADLAITVPRPDLQHLRSELEARPRGVKKEWAKAMPLGERERLGSEELRRLGRKAIVNGIARIELEPSREDRREQKAKQEREQANRAHADPWAAIDLPQGELQAIRAEWLQSRVATEQREAPQRIRLRGKQGRERPVSTEPERAAPLSVEISRQERHPAEPQRLSNRTTP